MVQRLDAQDAGFEAAFTALLEGKRESATDVAQAVADIIADVRARGDAALVDYTTRFDRLTLKPDRFRLSADEVAEYAAQARRCFSWRPIMRGMVKRAERLSMRRTQC